MAKFEKIPHISDDGSVDFTYKIDGKEVNRDIFDSLISDETIEHIPVNFDFSKLPAPDTKSEDADIETMEDLSYFVAQEVIDCEDIDAAAKIILDYIDQSATASYFSGRMDLANELKHEFINISKQTSQELDDYLNGEESNE